MGLVDTSRFPARHNALAALARALSHPARIAILQHLIDRRTCVCGELVDEIGLAQPTISRHLKELKQLGLIRGEVSGTRVCYCIDPARWRELSTDFRAFLSQDPGQAHASCSPR